MSTWEIRQLFRISRGRVDQLSNRPDFPKPIWILKTGRVWLGDDVRAWATAKGRPVYEIIYPEGMGAP